ncbi:hypothetical protein DFH29DRAFT_610262 [Suillus ampliporus]|nr:hypothetical protein DFH29DRAFT_610262 [Suillus ampliporus]
MYVTVTKLVQKRSANANFTLLSGVTALQPRTLSPMVSKKSSPSVEPVVARSLWQSYKALPARTRLYVSMAVCTVGAVGMFMSDYLEEKYPVTPPSTVPTYDTPSASRNAAGTT